MKSLKSYFVNEAKADIADVISLDLEAIGLKDGKDFKFEKDVLYARDMNIARTIADELAGQYFITISEEPRKSDKFLKITIK